MGRRHAIFWYQKSKGGRKHRFFVIDEGLGTLFLNSMFAYMDATWPLHKGTDRVFWQDRVKDDNTLVPHNQYAGKSWFYPYTKKVAEFLELPNPNTYTSHSVCRTGATLLADSGASLLELKQYGQWKSDCVAQRYVAESDVIIKKAARYIAGMHFLNSQHVNNVYLD